MKPFGVKDAEDLYGHHEHEDIKLPHGKDFEDAQWKLWKKLDRIEKLLGKHIGKERVAEIMMRIEHKVLFDRVVNVEKLLLKPQD